MRERGFRIVGVGGCPVDGLSGSNTGTGANKRSGSNSGNVVVGGGGGSLCRATSDGSWPRSAWPSIRRA